ncbi:ATP-binding cassette domain-containing protein [Actinacidiphila sp. DG2A-62]|uniref:ATP-binding cassette domain-containing protein n=1 Tax=Actinacidiphila sp. DG2A-62 TaxID=3108821 RepID=UPI002DB56405|nr:ATP-binding cassette domain-containing protein [Actinacidiphila sp. DG2A-62]MEC3993761.1 ATP-binding cassette domain-containing protein [Actinacidiphila sp. DG2A-62]
MTKRFGGVTAVDDVSFSIAAGEAVAVIGPNGAGKSSLLKLLSGVYRPDEGTVLVGGTAVETLPVHAIARHGIGLAHQIPRPFRGLTVRENVEIGAMARRGGRRAGHRDPYVDEVLETCGLAGKADLPAASLRLLDLKRLELARALSVDPALILLDEVAAGLNGRELEDVIALIRAIHGQGRSLMLVEHVEGVVASLVDRVLVIDWGKLIADGTPAQIAADPRVREVYLGAGRPARPAAPEAPRRPAADAAPLLRASALTTAYGDITALREVSVDVAEGEIVAVLGANGAGKSTLAGTLSGLLRPASGQVLLDGRDITGHRPHTRNREGIAHCPEGRRIFKDLTVRENLALPAGPRLRGPELRRRMADVHAVFPVLADFADRRAGGLSGGQQQMLAIGRALMSRPRLLICDEISLGLAPVAVDALYEALSTIRQTGVAVLLVEQNVHRALTVADRVYVLERGRVSYSGPPGPLADPDVLNAFYFGAGTQSALPSRG